MSKTSFREQKTGGIDQSSSTRTGALMYGSSSSVPAIGFGLIAFVAGVVTFSMMTGVARGLPFGVAVMTLASALVGLCKSLLDLLPSIQKANGGPDAFAPVIFPERRSMWLAIAVLLPVGALILGVWMVPRVIEASDAPKASINIPTEVSIVEDVGISWRNLPDEEGLCFSTRELGKVGELIQNCTALCSRNGAVDIQAEIGGRDDSSKEFEIRVLRLPRSLAVELKQKIQMEPYVPRLPEGARVLASKVVRRAATAAN
jgi:hypothetical protein